MDIRILILLLYCVKLTSTSSEIEDKYLDLAQKIITRAVSENPGVKYTDLEIVDAKNDAKSKYDKFDPENLVGQFRSRLLNGDFFHMSFDYNILSVKYDKEMTSLVVVLNNLTINFQLKDLIKKRYVDLEIEKKFKEEEKSVNSLESIQLDWQLDTEQNYNNEKNKSIIINEIINQYMINSPNDYTQYYFENENESTMANRNYLDESITNKLLQREKLTISGKSEKDTNPMLIILYETKENSLLVKNKEKIRKFDLRSLMPFLKEDRQILGEEIYRLLLLNEGKHKKRKRKHGQKVSKKILPNRPKKLFGNGSYAYQTHKRVRSSASILNKYHNKNSNQMAQNFKKNLNYIISQMANMIKESPYEKYTSVEEGKENKKKMWKTLPEDNEKLIEILNTNKHLEFGSSSCNLPLEVKFSKTESIKFGWEQFLPYTLKHVYAVVEDMKSIMKQIDFIDTKLDKIMPIIGEIMELDFEETPQIWIQQIPGMEKEPWNTQKFVQKFATDVKTSRNKILDYPSLGLVYNRTLKYNGVEYKSLKQAKREFEKLKKKYLLYLLTNLGVNIDYETIKKLQLENEMKLENEQITYDPNLSIIRTAGKFYDVNMRGCKRLAKENGQTVNFNMIQDLWNRKMDVYNNVYVDENYLEKIKTIIETVMKTYGTMFTSIRIDENRRDILKDNVSLDIKYIRMLVSQQCQVLKLFSANLHDPMKITYENNILRIENKNGFYLGFDMKNLLEDERYDIKQNLKSFVEDAVLKEDRYFDTRKAINDIQAYQFRNLGKDIKSRIRKLVFEYLTKFFQITEYSIGNGERKKIPKDFINFHANNIKFYLPKNKKLGQKNGFNERSIQVKCCKNEIQVSSFFGKIKDKSDLKINLNENCWLKELKSALHSLKNLNNRKRGKFTIIMNEIQRSKVKQIVKETKHIAKKFNISREIIDKALKQDQLTNTHDIVAAVSRASKAREVLKFFGISENLKRLKNSNIQIMKIDYLQKSQYQSAADLNSHLNFDNVLKFKIPHNERNKYIEYDLDAGRLDFYKNGEIKSKLINPIDIAEGTDKIIADLKEILMEFDPVKYEINKFLEKKEMNQNDYWKEVKTIMAYFYSRNQPVDNVVNVMEKTYTQLFWNLAEDLLNHKYHKDFANGNVGKNNYDEFNFNLLIYRLINMIEGLELEKNKELRIKIDNALPQNFLNAILEEILHHNCGYWHQWLEDNRYYITKLQKVVFNHYQKKNYKGEIKYEGGLKILKNIRMA